MFWILSYHEQVDLIGTNVIAIKRCSFAKHRLQFAFNCRKKVLVP